MLKEFNTHKLAYLILLVVLVLGAILFLGAWPDRQLQRLVAVVIAIFYLGWGVVTHLKTAQITKNVIFEYFGVGFLAGLLLILVTF